ncbi:hypothetical protein CDL15_Pgr000826 [Punica granatum]|uniref:Uncharacterized protein n=1 Tax=Punica granatum TaxID=22663 RepID=A0A218W3D9_PUNGR|nr:hypothetical protein CDL15_Pgr000826 [Punica granatum]
MDLDLGRRQSHLPLQYQRLVRWRSHFICSFAQAYFNTITIKLPEFQTNNCSYPQETGGNKGGETKVGL